MSVKTDLLAAADYIAEHGWCRNEFYEPNGQACLAGAVGIVTGALKPATPTQRRKLLADLYPDATDKQLAEALDGRGPISHVRLWDWSSAKAHRLRHGKAIETLAAQLDAERLRTMLAEFDAYTAEREQTASFQAESPESQQAWRNRRALDRSFTAQDIVTGFNDKAERTESKTGKKVVKRTSKAQAVALLRRAAAAA